MGLPQRFFRLMGESCAVWESTRAGKDCPLPCPNCDVDIRLISFVTEPGFARNSPSGKRLRKCDWPDYFREPGVK